MRGKWIQQDVVYLKENWKKQTIEELSIILGRTVGAIRTQASLMQLSSLPEIPVERINRGGELNWLSLYLCIVTSVSADDALIKMGVKNYKI